MLKTALSVLVVLQFCEVLIAAPNFLVIYSDDQQFRALGANGNAQISTPILDHFAAGGVRFTQARAALPVCSPSRAALLTGQYASANGVANLSGAINASSPSLAKHLQLAGYRTAVTGKWHVKNTPKSMGFDSWAIFHSNGDYYRRTFDVDGKKIKLPKQDNRAALHIDAYSAKCAVQFIRDVSKIGEPFFLWHNTQTPHMDGRRQWNARPNSITRYASRNVPLPDNWDDPLVGKPNLYKSLRNRTLARSEYGYADAAKIREHTKRYYAVVTEMDAMLDPVLQAIDDPNGDGDRSDSLASNTYIVFMSDNGWLMGDHGMTSKALPFDASTRVPLIIAGPGVDRDRIDSRQVLNIDVAPTVLELAGIPKPIAMHGKSVATLLGDRGQGPGVRNTSVVEIPSRTFAGNQPMLAAYDGRWELICNYRQVNDVHPSFVELYDLNNDPWELNNLAIEDSNAEQRDVLEAAIANHRRDILSSVDGTTSGAME